MLPGENIANIDIALLITKTKCDEGAMVRRFCSTKKCMEMTDVTTKMTYQTKELLMCHSSLLQAETMFWLGQQFR